MRRVLKILVLLAVLLALAAGGLVFYGDYKRQRKVDAPARAFEPATGSGALAAGKYLYETRGCAECHGEGGEGKIVIDAPNGLHVKSPGLGAGSVTAGYKASDWDRAIRHGISPARTPLLIMPSEDYNRLTDADLASLVAYIESLPLHASTPARIRFPVLMRALYGAGLIQDAAGKIDHRKPVSQPVPVGVTAQHGEYVAQMCKGCHGEKLEGGKIPGAPPDWPPASNISAGAGSAMARYADAGQFRAMMRGGKRPDGGEVSKVMPFASLSKMNDTDLDAMYLYLKPGRT